MAKKQIGDKILTGVTIAIAASLGLISVVHFYHFTGIFIPELESKAAAVGRTVRIPIERSLEVGLTKETLFGVNERLADAVDAYPDIESMYVIDGGGEIIFHSKREKIGRRINIEEITEKSMPVDIEARSAIIRDNGQRYRFIYLPISENKEIVGWIGINMSGDPVRRATRSYVLSTLATLIVAIISIWLAAKLVTKKAIADPLFILNNTALRLARGDFTARAFVSTNDELGTLAETFNFMAEEVKISRRKLEQNIETLKGLLETKTEFLQIVNHQLRTPITIMNGYLEFFRRGTYDSLTRDKKADIQGKILAALNQLNETIEGMMEAFELEGGHPEMAEEAFNLGEEIAGVIRGFEDAAKKKNLKIEKNISGGIEITSDLKHLKAIISNLVDNAIKYTPPGGKISISFTEKNNMATIKITDTGIGLSRDEIAMIFHKFTRTPEGKKMVPGGSGLGLYIARKISAEMGGEVTAESKGRNLGSTFTVELPIKRIK